MVSCFLAADLSESTTKEGLLKNDVTCEKHSKESSPSHLPTDEQQVYHQLGPLYQKIYTEVLNDEERYRVVVYTHRGLNPFEAINVILRGEERKYSKKLGDNYLPPSQRTSRGSVAPETL